MIVSIICYIIYIADNFFNLCVLVSHWFQDIKVESESTHTQLISTVLTIHIITLPLFQEHKHKVSVLEEAVSSAKSLYSSALRSLESISDEIHQQRRERRQQQQLGVRGSGVGAECPLPPPSWEKGLSIDGRDARHAGNCQSLDPLGVIKISSTVTYGGTSVSRQRSRNLSGESCHGNDLVEEENRAKDPPVSVSSQDVVASAADESKGGDSDGKESSSSPRDKQGVLIPGDPLGVLPPTYTPLPRTRHNFSTSSPSITHPAFTKSMTPCSPTHSSKVVHPFVLQAGASHIKTPGELRSKSASNVPEVFVPPSLVYSNPEAARRQSYRQAVEASQREAEDSELPENLDAPELDEVYTSLPCTEGRSRNVHDTVVVSRQRSHSNPAQPSDLKTRSPPQAILGKISTAVQEALADGRKHGSAPERSGTLTSYSQHAVSENRSLEGSPVSGSPSTARRAQKLQGLILRIDPTMDPLRNFEPRARSHTMPDASQGYLQATSPPTALTQTETLTPTPTPTQTTQSLPCKMPQVTEEVAPDPRADYSVSKPIIRSASTISTAGSERSETEFSDLESVSATQSPTKPRSRLLSVPTCGDSVEDSSDTESLASTGPMLDDEQVEFLNMDFSDISMSREQEGYASSTLPSPLTRNSWSRMSLPPRLSYLEEFLSRAKRLSADYDSTAPGFVESPTEQEGEEVSLSENAEGFMNSDNFGCSYKEGCSSQARSLPIEFDTPAPGIVKYLTEQTEQEGQEAPVSEQSDELLERDHFWSSDKDEVKDQKGERECEEAQDSNGQTKGETIVCS